MIHLVKMAPCMFKGGENVVERPTLEAFRLTYILWGLEIAYAVTDSTVSARYCAQATTLPRLYRIPNSAEHLLSGILETGLVM